MKARADNLSLMAGPSRLLRAKLSGRLDVRKIAILYGVPLGRFPEILNVSIAELRRNPDAKVHQARLAYFEQAVQIIPLLKSKNDFGIWARAPNEELKGKAPVDLLFATPKEAQRLVDAVQDVVTGQPD